MRQPPLSMLQRLAGNQAVAQLVTAPGATMAADPKARVDQLQLAIKVVPFPRPMVHIDLDKAVEALTDLTREDGQAIKAEYKRRTGWTLGWVITGQQDLGDGTLATSLARAEQTRLLNLLGGTVATPTDPEQAQAVSALVGGLVTGAASLMGGDGTSAAALGERAAGAAMAASEASDQQRVAVAEAGRYRAEAAQVRRALERKQADVALGLIRRPFAERQALASQYATLYGESIFNALVTRLSGRDAERARAIWTDDDVTADRLALESDLERQAKVEADTKEAEEMAQAFPALAETIKAKRRAARSAVEARLEEIATVEQPDTASGRAAGREHLTRVLAGSSVSGATLDARVRASGDRVTAAIIDRGEPEELAARLARADGEGTLKARDLEAALRQLRVLARKAAIREIEHQPAALAPQAANVLQAITDGYYQRFQDEFDQVATKRKLSEALKVGSDVEEARNRELIAAKGTLPAWRELDLALRRSPKDMDRVRQILDGLTHSEVEDLSKEYWANTTPHRSLRTDLLGTEAEQQARMFVDRDETATDLAEKRVLLQGGTFESASTDEATRLDEERRWLFGRFAALEQAVMANRGLFAEARDWLGNLEKDLVDRARTDAADASSAIAKALTDSPPDLAAARAALVQLRRATARIERNLAVYKEATRAAFDEFVDLAVLAVTTIVTAGQGSAIVMAIRTTIATVGTKAALKGADYSLDEFLMDLRSGLGAAAGGKLVEGVLEPIAKQVATYVGKTNLSKGFAGKVLPQLGRAGMWEAENLITTATGNVATGQDISSGMGLEAQAGNLVQEGFQAGIKGIRGGPTRGDASQDGHGPRPDDGPTPITSDEAGPVRTTDTSTFGPVGAEVADVVGERGPVTETSTPSGELRTTDPRVSMQLPEATSARPSRDEHAVRATEKDTGPTPDDATGPDTIPDQPVPQPDATSVGPSEFESERSRTTREDQASRGGRFRGDQETLRQTTAPDARSRESARDFADLLPEWPDLEVPERLERLERIVNARLAEAGLPKVYVELGSMPAGNAEFSMKEWKIFVSKDSLETKVPTLEAFAGIADATSHEARHALHMFRGYRVALMEGTFRSGPGISPLADVAAREANAGNYKAEKLVKGTPAYEEAFAIHQEFYRSRAIARRRKQNDRALAKAQYRVRQLRAERDRHPPGSGRRAELQEQLRLASLRLDRVHNTYISRSHEVDAWRMGSSTRAAVIEEVTQRRIATLQADLARTQEEGARHVANQQERRSMGADTRRVDDLVKAAMTRERQIEQEIDMLRRQLEASEAIRKGEEAPATEVWPPHEDFDATEPEESE